MTEQEAIEKIHSVYPSGKKEGLTNMRALMARLGDVRVPMVHVAGTNGKGSTCAMIERVLREAGYKTGLYTSPYIERYNERIRINGIPLSGGRLAALVKQVFPKVEECQKEGYAITEFELGTALALTAFEQERVDIAVIEVGLGGRLDPTNIIMPKVCVVTEVGMDHMQFLGNTIEEIALEKAGIFKQGTPVVLGPQEKVAHNTLISVAKGLDCPILEPEAVHVRESADDMTFDVKLPDETLHNLKVSLRGYHQAENACAALGALYALRSCGFATTEAQIRSGMADVHWPGRLERFGQVLLDGAHNDPGVRALCEYADMWLPREKTILLTGMMADKDVEHMAKRLGTRVHAVITTQPEIPRAMSAEDLAQAFRKQGCPVCAEPNPKMALEKARAWAGKDGTVLCAGSLYLIGAVRALLRQEKEFMDVI